MGEVGCLKDGCFQNLQVEGNMTALTDLEVTGDLSLGNKSQAAGVLTAKIDTGILNAPIKITTPAPASSSATGAHTLTAANFANGYVTVTGNGTADAVTMPAKSVFVTLFGSDAVVGDTFCWYLHNACTTVNKALVLTQSADSGATVPANQAASVCANAANAETSTVVGTSTAHFMTRLTNVDGSTTTYRLS